MLIHLLDHTSHATHSHGFAWCSMKSIRCVSSCHKITPCLVRSASIRVVMVPCLIVHRVSPMIDQAALQAASSFFTEKIKNGLYTFFPYQTTQVRNITLKPTKIEIWAKYPPTQNTWLILLPSQQSSLTCSSLLCLSETHRSFLHACTPERRTRALAHLFNPCTHGQTPDTKKHILQKNLQGAETLGNDSSGGASKPHRSKYMPVCMSVVRFIEAFRRECYGKSSQDPWCLY